MGGGVPVAVLVMAERGISDPVWARPGGSGDPVDLAALGAPESLAEQLRVWNGRYQDLAATDFEWCSPIVRAAWVAEGRRLAYELQNALPDVEVRYHEDGDGRPVRERRGR